MKDRIAEFLATVNSPENLKSAREKLEEAVELLRDGQRGKYMLFGGMDYYPQGGAGDLLGIFSTVESCQSFLLDERAKEKYEHNKKEWAHIYHDGKIILWYHSNKRIGWVAKDPSIY